jgi:hypothetical protein
LSFLLLSAMDEKPLASCLLELLLARLTGTATKDQLAPELPVKRNVPVLSSLLVDNRVVVLKIGAETLGLKGNPKRVLVHGVGLLRPVTKVMGVDGERLAKVFDGLGVFVEEDLGISS